MIYVIALHVNFVLKELNSTFKLFYKYTFFNFNVMYYIPLNI